MKTPAFVRVFVITFLASMCFYCSENATTEPENSPPECFITSPQNNSLFNLNDNVEIKIEAEDSDGEIKYVSINIDGIVKTVDYDLPYEFSWRTSGEDNGSHIVNIYAVDNDDAQSSEQNVRIILGDSADFPIEESPWETSSPQNVGLDASLLDALHEKIRNDYSWMECFLIARNGKLVFEKYYGGYSRNTMVNTYCTAKSFAGAFVGIAIDKGYIENEDVPIFDYFPEYAHLKTSGKEKITIKDLLTMSSGLEWNEMNLSYSNPLNDNGIFSSVSDPFGYFLSKPLIYAPGTKWYYKNAGVNVLGEIVRRVTGMEVDLFTKENLFRPLGIKNHVWAYYSHGQANGHARGHGLQYLTARDMAKFGQLYLNEGVWNGEQIISKDWVSKSGSYLINVGDPRGYGYLFWVAGDEYYYALGAGGQYIFIMPEYDIVVVSTNNFDVFDTSTHHNQVNIIPGLIQNYVIAAVNSN